VKSELQEGTDNINGLQRKLAAVEEESRSKDAEVSQMRSDKTALEKRAQELEGKIEGLEADLEKERETDQGFLITDVQIKNTVIKSCESELIDAHSRTAVSRVSRQSRSGLMTKR